MSAETSTTNQLLKRNAVAADRAYGVLSEREPDGHGRVVDALTLLLTASECPIGCSMCDLWRNTLPTPTPLGAIPGQIATAIAGLDPIAKPHEWIKLYNSGNFFDPRSVPTADYELIAELCQPFSRVVVENHPRFGVERLQQFRDLISAQLEVAVGLETVQPRWLDRLNKQMTRADFERYANLLHSEDVDLRVFLIVGVPGISVSESIRWARLSVKHAFSSGARHVSLIPARVGHGWNGRAAELPKLDISVLQEFHQAALSDVAGKCVVTMDVWDLDDDDAAALAQQNLKQQVAS